ncbi:RNA polymerase binding protein [Aeromonas phage GomatiRiver_11]|nr:15 kDa RNA polymerase-binding protein [Aeromonas phage AhFM11]WKW84277.1 RNA polymerase binding protein [Aeromonas phage GomatiRiver_11]
MRNQAVVVIPSDLRLQSDNLFETMNKIRKAWVANITDAKAAQLQVLAPEVRFELYADLDKEVREMYIELMKQRKLRVLATGGYMVRGMNDKLVLAPEFQVDTDELLIQAAELVMADYNS